jgi:hypothetical protein
MIAGVGITGGGTLAADRTFDLDAASNLNIDHSAVDLLAGTGIDATGLGDLTADRTINLDTANNRNVDHSAVVLTGGVGIQAAGLGDITASRTINADVATTSQQGIGEIATQTEVNTGGDVTSWVTPSTLTNFTGLGGSITVTTGTYVPTWLGFSSAPAVNARWTLYANDTSLANEFALHRFIAPGSAFGTSNATTMSIDNLPADVTPTAGIASDFFGGGLITNARDDSSSGLLARVVASFGNALVYALGVTAGGAGDPVGFSSSGWTASNSKGQEQQTSAMWITS